MVYLGFKIENTSEAREYIKGVVLRSESEDIVKNPFIVRNRFDLQKEFIFYFASFVPVWPKVYYLGLITAAPIFLFLGLSWWLLPSLFLYSLIFFYSRYFYALMFLIGLKKAGFKGFVRFLNYSQIIGVLTKWHK